MITRKLGVKVLVTFYSQFGFTWMYQSNRTSWIFCCAPVEKSGSPQEQFTLVSAVLASLICPSLVSGTLARSVQSQEEVWLQYG